MSALTIPAVTRHTATVIMAHGLGDTGYGWESMAKNWRAKNKFPEVKFIFPHAPKIPITMNMGLVMPGWYDIMDLGDLPGKYQDEAGVYRSRDYFNSLIEYEVKSGIARSRIMLGGFSQGGAMALFTGITHSGQLGGIFGLSSYLVMHMKVDEYISDDSPSKATPIFLGHGDGDTLVKYKWALKTQEILRSRGFEIDLHTYRGLQHSADPREIDDLEKFFNERIPAYPR